MKGFNDRPGARFTTCELWFEIISSSSFWHVSLSKQMLYLQSMHEHERAWQDSQIYLQFACDNHLRHMKLPPFAICMAALLANPLCETGPWLGNRTCQVPVVQLENVLEQVSGKQLQASDTVVLDTGERLFVVCAHITLLSDSTKL